MGIPFIFLLILTFGVLLAVLGGFLLVWARGKPRIFGTGFLVCGIIVCVALAFAIWTDALLPDTDIILDVIAPGVVYFLAILIGAVLAVVPFLVAAIRT